MSDGKRMTRRGFVGAALAGTMGVAASSFLAGCSAPTSSSDSQEWDQEADVVVVGAGGAGLAAAIEAANAGASVLLLEKASAVGGDSALSDGILGGWGTKLAKEQGIDADADDVYRWFTRHPEWYGPKDPAIARVLADKSGETIDWLQEMGVPFLKEVGPLFGYTELPVIHHVDGKGAEMVRVLAETAEKAGVGTLTDTSATKLVADADGRVIGVEAVQKKNPVRIKANKGVVMAMELGAYTTRVSDMPLMSSLAGLESGSIVNINYGMRLPGLWLDAEGQRFFDESTPYENPNGHRAIVRKQNEQGSPVIALLGTTPELDAMQATYPLKWATADTVEEVAGMVGLDGAKAKATVERYNGFCEAGKDEDCGTPADKMVPMTGPFYAAPIAVSTSVTVGGFKTNEQAQALRLALASSGSLTEPIPGLYAAGVVCEWNCAAGATVLSAMTLGRIAGRSAAAEASAA